MPEQRAKGVGCSDNGIEFFEVLTHHDVDAGHQIAA